MFYGVLTGRTCCRVSTRFSNLLHNFSSLVVHQSRHEANGPLKYLYISRVVSQRTCSTQQDLNTEQTRRLEMPERNLSKFSQQKMNENTDNDFDTSISPILGDEDTSDPCAGLDFNDMTSENSAASIQDRFPLPSEPLDKG